MTPKQLKQLHARNGHCFGYNGTTVECFDPLNCSRCTRGAAHRSALVLVDDLVRPWSSGKIKMSAEWIQKWAGWARSSQAELVFMVPSKAAKRSFPGQLTFPRNELSPGVREALTRHARLVEVPWVVPPNISKGVPHKTYGLDGCCGLREYMRMHLFGLTDYDAAIYVDTDMEVRGDLRPLFDCAASGLFLNARDVFAAVNSGFFAVRPEKRLLGDMLRVLSTSRATKTGWNGWPRGPNSQVGQFAMQGFLFYYMYQHGPLEGTVEPVQVEPCVWTGAGMCKDLACPDLVLNHKQRCDPESMRLSAEKRAEGERLRQEKKLLAQKQRASGGRRTSWSDGPHQLPDGHCFADQEL